MQSTAHRSVTLVALAVATLGASLLATTHAYAAAAICVGTQSRCYTSLQAAVNAAASGSTIEILPGTVAGGVTISKDLTIVGAGAARTRIAGGGPVLTLGTLGATHEPSIAITGVTISGGVTRSSALSEAQGSPGLIALGGGIEIPPNAQFTGGAAVTITDTVIRNNRVAPSTSGLYGPPCPNGQPCPFAQATGGGIDNWGNLTLRRTAVVDNMAGAATGLSDVASDAYGGGIQNWIGTLTIDQSTVSANRAAVTAPNGRFADSGAIFVEGGSLSMSGSTVTGNSARATIAFPASVDTLAIAGGIHVGGDATATISRTVIDRNRVSMINSAGPAFAFSGGVHTDTTFTLDHDLVANNDVAAVASGPSGDAEGDSGAGEIGGTITDTQLLDNRVSVRSAGGDAYALAGAAIAIGTFTRTIVAGNRIDSRADRQHAVSAGAGLDDGGDLTIDRTVISHNHGTAIGPTAISRGGGIFSGATNYAPPASSLIITESAITNNDLRGAPGATLEGGGVYTSIAPTLSRAIIRDNTPDQLYRA